VAYLRSLTIDEALARTDPTASTFLFADGLGSTVALTDAAGATATEYTYEPYGRTEATGTPSANPFHYTGRENDGTGLYYYRARYYDQSRGRFLVEDPIGFAGGNINLFAYVLNKPTGYIDPLGREVFLFGRQLPFYRFFLAQRPVVRPIPRVTPEPEPLEPPPWTPAPDPLPRIPQLRNPKQPGFPHTDLPACFDGPCLTPGSVPPLIGPPIPGPREKPAPRPEPQIPPEWEECYRARLCA